MGDRAGVSGGILRRRRRFGRTRGRTIFMVGDFKQAIFGFQGTDPKELRMRATGFASSRHHSLTADDDAKAGAASNSAICRSKPASVPRRQFSTSSTQ